MPPRLIAALLAGLVMAGACGGNDAKAPAPQPAKSHEAPAPKPVLDENFPDPDLLRAGDTYYAYATQPTVAGRNIQLATSPDLKRWSLTDTDPLPQLPAWAVAGRTWAPDVSAVSSSAGGGYVMYFTAHSGDPDLQCIGVARGTSPRGPFRSTAARPLVCPATEGGAIDPASFVDRDGSRYLLWKNDGNCCGKDTWLQLQPVSPDGTTLTGPPRKLVKQTLDWEGSLVEAPDLVRHDATYVLFYAANDYGGDKYATGYATASAVQGPYTKSPRPLLSSAAVGIIGPGGADVVSDPHGGTVIAFHGWDESITQRGMFTLPLTWRGAVPSVSR